MGSPDHQLPLALHRALVERLQLSAALVEIKLKLEHEILASQGRIDLHSRLPQLLADWGGEAISNAITCAKDAQHKASSRRGDAAHEPEVWAAAARRWQQLLVERITATQSLLPWWQLAEPMRDAKELQLMRGQVADLKEAWERIGSASSPFVRDACGHALTKLLYDGADVLHALTGVPAAAPQSWVEGQPQQDGATTRAATHFPLLMTVKAPTRAWLQSFFADLHPSKWQVGVDDVVHPWYLGEQVQRARRLGASGAASACREACRRGIPASERPLVWAAALGLPVYGARAQGAGGGAPVAATAAAAGGAGREEQQPRAWCRRDEQAFEALCTSVEALPLLLDCVTCSDVQHMVDNEHYFVFEEALRAIMLAFSRDASIADSCGDAGHPRFAVMQPSTDGPQQYPASGVLPFQGLAAYAAPLLYVYQHPAAAYKVHRALYCRYWCRLHALGSELALLTRTCQALVEELDPEVCSHVADNLGSSCLHIAFPLLLTGCVGVFTPADTLALWDRVIGFDSMLPLAVVAAAVMVVRRDLILAAASVDELIEPLQDLSHLRTVPLLQAALFAV